MKARHQAVAGMIAVALVAGCQDKSKKAEEPSQQSLLAQQDPPPQENTPTADATPVAEPPAISDIELITRKAEAHARRVAEEMQKQAAAQSRPLSAQAGTALTEPVAPQPSAVEWLDPNAYRIGPAPQTDRTPAPAVMAPAAAKPLPMPTAPVTTAAPAEPEPIAASTANKPVSIDDATPVVASASLVSDAPPIRAAVAADQPGARLEAALAQAIRDYPRDVSTHLDYQLLQFIQGKQAPDLSAIATLPEEDQEIVSAVLDSLSNFRHTIRSDSNPLLSRKVKPLMDLGERLRSRADLEVPTVQLCKRVDGYGVYEPIEQRFVAGQQHQVIVYCEIENFMSQLNGQNLWETKVTEELVLYTENDGLPILREKPVVVPDVCRNRRNDFFIVRKLVLPPTIPVGRYLLKVTVVDQLASRVAEATLPITFVAN